MHACGNPLHDLPQWIIAALPFLPQMLAHARHLAAAAAHRVRSSLGR